MEHPENNEKNRRELAEKVVSLYDVSDLRDLGRLFSEVYEELRESMKENCPNPGCHCGACEKKDVDIEDWQIEEALNGRR